MRNAMKMYQVSLLYTIFFNYLRCILDRPAEIVSVDCQSFNFSKG